MTSQIKIQKLLALTESSNDHEALNALRRVQQILTQTRTTLATYVSSNQTSAHAHPDLARELRMAQANVVHWKVECERLSTELMLLRMFPPKASNKKSTSKAKSEKAKLAKLKSRISDLENDNQMFEKIISELEDEIKEMRRKKSSSAKGNPESLLRGFVDKHYVCESETSWIGTKDLHQIFKGMSSQTNVSVSYFSRVFSKLTGCRSSKGGPRKQTMGFCVVMKF